MPFTNRFPLLTWVLSFFHRKWSETKSSFPKIFLGIRFLCFNQACGAWSCFSATWVSLAIRATSLVGSRQPCVLFSTLLFQNYFKDRRILENAQGKFVLSPDPFRLLMKNDTENDNDSNDCDDYVCVRVVTPCQCPEGSARMLSCGHPAVVWGRAFLVFTFYIG